jgi:hypothetical protein
MQEVLLNMGHEPEGRALLARLNLNGLLQATQVDRG